MRHADCNSSAAAQSRPPYDRARRAECAAIAVTPRSPAAGGRAAAVHDNKGTSAMVTGTLKSQVDRVWDAFWSGGISNPLEVIEQITYLLFLRRLDDLQTLEENKATGTQEADGARGSSRRARTPTRPPLRGPALVALQELRARGDVRRSSPSTSSRSCARLGGDGIHLRAPHEGRALHHPHARAAREGRRPARRRPDGGPRHQGRPLRVHARQDRHAPGRTASSARRATSSS